MGCDPFSRVGACGRRPLESADPGGVRVGPYKRVSNRWSLVGVYGRGRGARGCTKENQEMVVLWRESEGSALWGRLRGRSRSKEAFGGLPESFCELQGGPKWSKWDQYGTNLSFREAKRGLKVS